MKWKESDEAILREHDQLYDWSCIPMVVELILKLIGLLPPKCFELQHQWNKGQYGNFSDFDGRVERGVKFTKRFSQDRGPSFPRDDLFAAIEDELNHKRYVALALKVGDQLLPDGTNVPVFHNFVVYDQLPGGEFAAVTKCYDPEKVYNIRQWVRSMDGTDILTYEIL